MYSGVRAEKERENRAASLQTAGETQCGEQNTYNAKALKGVWGGVGGGVGGFEPNKQ